MRDVAGAGTRAALVYLLTPFVLRRSPERLSGAVRADGRSAANKYLSLLPAITPGRRRKPRRNTRERSDTGVATPTQERENKRRGVGLKAKGLDPISRCA